MLERVCKKCGHKVTKSELEEYPFQCNNCDEDLYSFETDIINAKDAKIVSIINGINIIYEDNNDIISDVNCKKCGKLLRYGEVIDDYQCCSDCRQE
ncbi:MULTISPECIES: hypothetical protein [unclassified Clostridium]|uniref:hypothetical protein n=1 Tax=unclassified Clostridium TaxID=2614128 RepID=UPI0025BF40BD|nr:MULTISPECIES: hypothetical protein [unclassified Clostridium]